MSHHDIDLSANDWPFSKYAAGHFGLRELLGPVVRDLLEWRLGWPLPERIQKALYCISMMLMDLIEDDELGLVDASPEDRVRLALILEGMGHD